MQLTKRCHPVVLSSLVALFASSLFAAPPRLAAQLSGEFIYEKAPFPQCHASTIVETPAGLVVAFFGGTHEKHPDVGIWVSRQMNGAWTPPVEVANGVQSATLRHPCWNPVLVWQPSGQLLLFFKVGPSPRTWWGEMLVSNDMGKTWQSRKRLPDTILGPVRAKPLRLTDGALLCGSSTEHDGWRVHFEVTRDSGKSWNRIGPVNDGKQFGAIQPTIADFGGGNLLALCRSQQGVLTQVRSADGGLTWGEMTATELPNPSAGVDIVNLRDGRKLLIYNHTKRGGASPKNREMLNLALTSDGKSWQAAGVLELDPQSRAGFSYPAMVQARDGRVHATYTWNRTHIKHVVIDPAKLVARPIKNGQWPSSP